MSVNVRCVVCEAQSVHTLKCSKELNPLSSVIFCMSGAYLASWLLPYFFPLVPCRKFFELVANWFLMVTVPMCFFALQGLCLCMYRAEKNVLCLVSERKVNLN